MIVISGFLAFVSKNPICFSDGSMSTTRFVNTVLFSNPNSPVFRFIIDTMTINVGRCVGLMRSLIFMFDRGFIKTMDDLDDIFGVG